jgi:CBS domain-containing protein
MIDWRENPMNAAEIMSHPVIGIGPDEPIAEAARKMLQHRISGLPVILLEVPSRQ